jgi:glutathione reductase (NADPH)
VLDDRNPPYPPPQNTTAACPPRSALRSLPSRGTRLNAAAAQLPTNPSPSLLRRSTTAPTTTVATNATANNNNNEKTADGYDYDLFFLGAGSGGVRGARFASSYGARVAVAEMPLQWVSSDTAGGVGGTCVLRGCVPKKLMVYASEYADFAKQSAGFGWQVDPSNPAPEFAWDKFMAAKRAELTRLNSAYKNTLKNAGVELIEGRATVAGPHEIDVAGVGRFTAKNIVVAVGGKPARLSIPGAEHCIDSDQALELPTRPHKVAILGSGFIALEFGGIFKRFGGEVDVVYRQPLPLRGFDEEVRRFAAEQYAATGLNLHSECTPVEVRKDSSTGKLTLVVKHTPSGEKREISGLDQVMMATGRAPRTGGLGLEEAGVELGKNGKVVVDRFSATRVPSIHAIGDVTDRINLTPVALMEGMALAKTLVLGEPTEPDYSDVPSAVFSWPQISTVGLTEEQAAERYGAGGSGGGGGSGSGKGQGVDVYVSTFRPMRNTISGSPLRTMMKMLVDRASGRVVGVHMVGDDAAEIMQGMAVAVKCGATKAQVDSTVGIHPSAAEELVTMRSATRTVGGAEEAKKAAVAA